METFVRIVRRKSVQEKEGHRTALGSNGITRKPDGSNGASSPKDSSIGAKTS